MGKVEMKQDYNMKQQQLEGARSHGESVEEKLEFVREQKEKLKKIKGDFKTNKTDARKVDIGILTTEWRGSNYGLFHDSFVEKLCEDKYETFIGEVDDNLDALVTEERKLENELLENDGLIGKLKQGLNWLESEIEKVVN